ncbi:MAG TPA: UTP--glucose-1-phosphate uridylyltransferase GalU [Gammaproteobacteria bacterium]|nr:UTP--glucose-1-phosphate uridylyltransferase GalU [Gammaproteobacteria bacterium]
MTQQKIRKAVFPVAGMGTRFLPATKASPKEMLPIVDKPLIQYAVEEAVAAGMTQMIFVNGRNKHSIPNHFDKAYELEVELESRGKHELLKMVQGIIPDNVTCIYIRQAEPLGLGHAVLCAQPVVGNEPFAVILADDLIDGENDPCLSQMTRLYDDLESSILGVQQVASQDTDKYGIVDSESIDDALSKVNAIVEKPKPEEAPSTLGVVGRYILTPRIFDLLEKTERGSGGEIQLTDAIDALRADEDVYAYRFEGTRYDCGNKLGYLQATVEYALKHPELSEEFSNYLHTVSTRK